uniref:Trichohyalin-plectin-homology domain-containing protein n=1 Tax=Fibrocapsa japonica TaxID=94617 RepID=A0A7S2V736_9STRA|mmetsp:Transcript_9534/g.14624  ORF Transcript_9534/g.14624 Transcript_9534/m.14624 type:complete len:241 (+) Transcript_9534:145-867(+)
MDNQKPLSGTLEQQMAALGLSTADLEYPPDGEFNKTIMTRVESAQILSKKMMDRDRVKQEMLETQESNRRKIYEQRRRKRQDWQKRTQKSPFHVDLVAETEKIDEENRVRLAEERRRMHAAAMRKEKAKNEIILKALSEASDLEALRREKRAIHEEEKRLKALLDIEKTKAHRKQDLLAAQLGERQRKQTKSEFRRKNFQDALEAHLAQETAALRQKLDVPPRPDNTFESYGADTDYLGI